MRKVWMYIDGYNFYYGIHNRNDLPLGLGWCDFRKLAEQHMIGKDCTLERIKYFTSRVPNDLKHSPGEDFRQDRWLQAVKTIDGLEIVEGFYTPDDDKFRQEKQTDVRIAVELILDAIRPDGYDEAILVTGDIDLAPAVLAVQKRIPTRKAVNLWIPLSKPSRRWGELIRSDKVSCQEITPEMLADSRLPDRIVQEGKTPIDCLPGWKMPTK